MNEVTRAQEYDDDDLMVIGIDSIFNNNIGELANVMRCCREVSMGDLTTASNILEVVEVALGWQGIRSRALVDACQAFVTEGLPE